MRRGKEIALDAMKKEHRRLLRVADKAKVAVDEYLNTGSELSDVLEEFKQIVESRGTGAEVVRKLGALKARKDRATRIGQKDAQKLFDRQYETEEEARRLGSEIQMAEFRLRPR